VNCPFYYNKAKSALSIIDFIVTRVYTPINSKKEMIVIIAGKGALFSINDNGIFLLLTIIAP
jgi:hypothetical protein